MVVGQGHMLGRGGLQLRGGEGDGTQGEQACTLVVGEQVCILEGEEQVCILEGEQVYKEQEQEDGKEQGDDQGTQLFLHR